MPQPPVITGFKLNARFPSGSPALEVCRAEGLRSHTTAGTQGEGAVDAAPALQAPHVPFLCGVWSASFHCNKPQP